jgi:hypothetical protein
VSSIVDLVVASSSHAQTHPSPAIYPNKSNKHNQKIIKKKRVKKISNSKKQQTPQQQKPSHAHNMQQH